MPEVSFLMPVRNGGAFIDEALSSLLAQDHSDFDIVVIDDGSNDDTRAKLERIEDDRLRCHFLEPVGLVGALNFGLDQLDCRYVARMDADDISFPNRLSSQLEFKNFTDTIAVSCRSLHIDAVGTVLRVSGHYPLSSADPTWCPPREPYLPHPFLLADLDVLSDLRFRPAHHSEDADLCWRLSEIGRIALQMEPLGKYRLHSSSVSSASDRSGRIQAVFAALAALNATRRANSAREVPYDKALSECVDASKTVEELTRLFGSSLTSQEQGWVMAAASMKLGELSRWRGYSLSTDDVKSARDALKFIARNHASNLHDAKRIFQSCYQQYQSGLFDSVRRFWTASRSGK